jgi:hypothetical protein
VPGWTEPWLWTGASWAGLQCGVLAIAAVVGLYQLGEARRLRKGSLRPFVVVDFEVDAPEVYVAVSNMGRTMARDVRVTFDAPFESGVFADDQHTLRHFEERFAAGLHSMPPGKKIRTLLDLGTHRPAGKFNDRYTASIAYKSDVTGDNYCDTVVLDYDLYRNLVRVERKDIHDVHERLKEIATETKKWSPMGGGIAMVTSRDLRLRTARMVGEHAARNRHRVLRPLLRVRLRLLRFLP